MADQRGEYHGAETSLPSLKKPCLWRRYGLHRLYSRNVRHGKPPYWQVHLRTAGELLWILHVRDWRGAIIPQSDKVAKKAKWFTWQRSGDGSEAQRLRSADLQGINLKEVDLSCIVLDGTNLSNADLRRASLRSASVVDTELTGALINETNWQETRLLMPDREPVIRKARETNIHNGQAPFSGVELLTRAELIWAQYVEQMREQPGLDLSQADLRRTKISDRDLADFDLEHCVLIDDDRVEELEAVREENLRGGRPSYAGIKIRNRHELLWIKTKRGWSNTTTETVENRPDLRNADLSNGTFDRSLLVGARLGNADLRHTRFREAELAGADLTLANAENADFTRASLQDAFLQKATLSHASLFAANIAGADVRFAVLRGTDARFSDLRGSDLRESVPDERTLLDHIFIDSRTKVQGIRWSRGVPLMGISWKHMPRLGDEALLEDVRTRAERARILRSLVVTYLRLADALRSQNMLGQASHYRLRARQLGRQIAWEERHYLTWVVSSLVAILTGYGERPQRTLIFFFSFLLMFAVIFLALSYVPAMGLHQLSLIQAIRVSLGSFGVQSDVGNDQLEKIWVLRAFQTLVGWFILLAFTVLFSRRLVS